MASSYPLSIANVKLCKQQQETVLQCFPYQPITLIAFDRTHMINMLRYLHGQEATGLHFLRNVGTAEKGHLSLNLLLMKEVDSDHFTSFQYKPLFTWANK